MRRDVAYSVKLLARSRGYTAATVLSLALGIGGTTALFSILDSLILKPLPVRDSQYLIGIADDQEGQDASLTYPIWREIRDRELVNEAFVWASDQVTLFDGIERKGLEALWVDGRFFERLSLNTLLGRPIGPADDRRGGGTDGPVAVLADSFWTRAFGADPSALGRTVNVNGVAYKVIGVTAPEFCGLEIGKSIDVILPLESEPLLGRVPSRVNSPAWPWLHIDGRVQSGDTPGAVQTRLRAAQPQIRDATMPAYSKPELRNAYLAKPWSVRRASTGSSGLRARYTSALLVLLAVVACVLLIACANLANLQLARTTERRYEFSIRSALGASRRRIVQQQLVESTVLAASGAIVGAAFSQSASRLIVAQLANWASTPFLDLSFDWRVLLATTAVTIVTIMLFGAAPASRAASAAPLDALKSGSTVGVPRRSFAAAVVIVQVAVSLVLVVGAALFLRSFAALAYRDLGFDRQRVLVAVVEAGGDPSRDKVALARQLPQAVAAVPGVESAAVSMATPLGNAGLRFTREILLPDGSAANAFTVPIGPEWFRTYGTRLLAGRDFSELDTLGAPGVAVVNQSFVHKFLNSENAIGRELVIEPQETTRQLVRIVGVVNDAAFTSVRDRPEPTLYRPLAQFVDEELKPYISSLLVSVRTAPGIQSETLYRGAARAIERVDARVSVSFLPLSRYLDANYTRERLLAVLSGFFVALGLLLAAIGLYGVTDYFANLRRREMGLRMALGATARDVIRLICWRFGRMVVWGLATGLVLSWWTERIVRTLLYGVDAHDLAIYGAASALLCGVAALANWIPARRAANLNPADVLKT